MFSLCSPFRGGIPSSWWEGVPCPRSGQGWGVPHPADREGGYPFPGLNGGGGYPIQLTGGIPFPGLDRGYPIQLTGGTPPGKEYPPPHRGYPPSGVPPYQSSTACTFYAAGGVPLAFMQEDFLVYIIRLHGDVFPKVLLIKCECLSNCSLQSICHAHRLVVSVQM